MNINKVYFGVYQVTLVFLAVSGCVKITPVTQDTPVENGIIDTATSSSNTATLVPIPIYSPVPFANGNEEMQLVNILQSEDCMLPCYLGITPGKTTLDEARNLLEELRASYVGDFHRKDGAIEYAYYLLKIGMPQENKESPAPEPSEASITQRISVISKDGIVQIIDVGASTRGLMPRYREIWRRYLLPGVFSQLGIPDRTYLNKVEPGQKEYSYGRTVIAIYEAQGVVVELSGNREENNVCPKKEAVSVGIRLSLFNPASGLDIYADGRVQPSNRDVYLPIEEVLGITTKQFYDKVVLDPSVCFEPN